MKKIATILSILIIALSLQAQAQTKKQKAKPKKAISANTTSTTVKKVDPPKADAPKTETKTVAVSTPKRTATVTDDYYKTALGVKFLHGISLTAKHFINEKGALEAVIQYRHYTDVGSEINFTGLYEYHGKIAGAGGLRWYVGGGAYAGYFSSDNDAVNDLNDGSSNFTFGVAGTVGLEYKIKGAPLAISADWQPLYIINGNSGLATDNGGIGVKYTF
ncbi:MAG: hypothetical protein V4456_17510 [Bacteroidota bacterium]